jgi:SAM-dependent methyltransferase
MTKKKHLGAGRHRLEGWENYDREVDITKPLPWEPGSVDFIFAEHVIEHVPLAGAVSFADEALRVLKPGGVLRLSFPDATRLMCLPIADVHGYEGMLARKGLKVPGPAARERCIRSVLTEWGHQSAWTYELAWCLLRAAGFLSVAGCDYGDSMWPELLGVDGHHQAHGVGDIAIWETTIVEGRKAADGFVWPVPK